MSWLKKVLGREDAPAVPAPQVEQPEKRVVESAGAQSNEDDEGWTRLSGDYAGSRRDLAPMRQDRMQRIAEWLWQSNLLANRLVELPLAYLLAEGVTLQCTDEDNQKLLDGFWRDPINNFPLKLEARARDLALKGEQCYIAHVNTGNGVVRLGYLDAGNIAHVVMDPDNPEQPIGVVTKKDAKGKHHKYRVIVLGEDSDLFSDRTVKIRADDFQDGECFLYQVNKLVTGTRGRSDLLAQADWLDAYDEFLFGEFDRARYLRAFVWDLQVTGSQKEDITARAKTFKPPSANSTFVHNENEKLTAVAPELQSADTAEAARVFRNHVLGGATMPEHWFGGGGDVNRAAAAEMGGPTFKVYTARQKMLKLMLEDMGRFVLWKAASTGSVDWSDDKFKVTAVFPELVNHDVTKFASAMQQVATTVTSLIEAGLLTEERALLLIADIAQRFGQEIDAKAELAAAKAEKATRDAKKARDDSFNLPADQRDLLQRGDAKPAVAPAA